MKLTQLTLALSLSILAASTTISADEGADLYKGKVCHTCHGADAKSPIMPLYPKIAGQSKEYLVQQMTDIKSGARNNGQSAAMKGIMAGVSEEEITKLADYISTLK